MQQQRKTCHGRRGDLIAAVLIILAMLLIMASCNKSQQVQSEGVEEIDLITQGASEMRISARRLDGKPCRRKVDWQAHYQSGLRKYGVNTFSTESLIGLMDSNTPSIRYYSALLLGERKELSAIPRLETALKDESLVVQCAATQALLKMGNRKGIKVLQEYCEKVSKEVENGDYRNLTNMLNASRVLADAGEVSAIPYLRQLAGYHGDYSWGIRLGAVRSLSKLHKKDVTVLEDIASMVEDEHPQIRKEASKILQRIEATK